MSKLRIAQTGAYGHYEYATADAGNKEYEFVGIAPGVPDEPMDGAYKAFRDIGAEPAMFSSQEEMLDKTSPDILIVNSVFSENAKYASEALERGIHVFCEKPAALSLNELSELEKTYKAANSGGRVCYCPMYGIMYTRHFNTAWEYCSSGALGDIRLCNARKSYKLGTRPEFYCDRATYGGIIPWVAIHAIDWAVRLGGFDITSVSATHSSAYNGGQGTLETTSLSLFECRDGKAFSVSADMMRPSGAPTHDDDRIRLVGTGGILEVAGGTVTVTDGYGTRVLENYAPAKTLFGEFTDEILGKGKCRVTAEDAFYTTRAALCARESADVHRRVFMDEGKTR